MESKKINQLATNVNPQTSDLTTIGDPITGQLKKITWLQVAHLIGAQASVTLQQVTDNGNTTTDPITTGGLTLTNLGTGVPQVTNGEFVSTYGYGLANGVATLDSGGKIPASQLPSSVMEYKGTWNASTNTPTLADGTGDNGDVYLVNVAGSQNLGSGTISFAVGDWVVYNGTIWQKSLNSNAVASVFGRTGTIVAQEGDYNIDQLGDVAITSAATNDYLRYNGSSWVNTQFPTFVSSDKLVLQVRNNSGATINKGTVVYINGATAGYPTIAKAQADADNTSAQTLGLVQDNISNNSNGVVVIVGQITGIDTSAYPAGTQLYLSGTTAGAFTSTKTLAPTHLVYVGIVTTQNAVNGVIEVKIQNGYELDEIHDVAISSVANNQGLFYESATSLWKNKSIATVLGYTPEQPLTFSAPLSRSTNTVSIPAATGSVNGYLTSTDWTTFNNKLTSPMTTLGDIIFGGTSGNANRLAGNITTTKQYLSQTGTGTESASPTWATITGSDITGAALTKSDDTNVTLTLGGTPSTALLRAASLTLGWTGTLAVSRGGTGASSFGSNEIIYGNSASALQSSSQFTFSPTGVFFINNTISAGGIAMNLTSTVNAAANNDIIYGVRISPTFNNGAFTGVTQRALGVFGNVYINGTITGAGWGGSVIGSNYGGAGTVSGILKANGSGVVSAAVAGTDYVIPSALNSYLPLTGGTLTNTGGNGTPILIFAGSSTDSFQWMTRAYNASLAAGNTILHMIGKSSGNKNAGYIGFQWNGDASNDNFVSIGLFNNDHLLRVYPTGNVAVTNRLDATHLSIIGNITLGATTSNIFVQNTNASVNANIRLAGSNQTAYFLDLASGNDNHWIYGSGTKDLVIGTNGTTRITVKGNSYNVGFGIGEINTWNGAQGTVLVQYSATGNSIYSLQSNTTTVDQGGVFEGYSNAVTSGSKALGSIAFLRENTSTTALSSYTAFYTNNAGTVSEKVRIESAGNMYITAASTSYGFAVTNINDSSQGLLVRSTDADTTLYLARFQSSASAVSQTWVDRFSIAKNGSTVIGDNIPAVNVRLWVKGEDQTASNYALDVTDSAGQSIAWFRNDKAIRFNGALTGTSATFNIGSAALSSNILIVKGGGSSGAFGFRVEANNGDNILSTNNLTYGTTLGGALSGTSATFSSNLQVNSYQIINGVAGGTSTYLQFNNNGSTIGYIGSAAAITGGGSTSIAFGNSSGLGLVINSSTGAATFSSSVRSKGMSVDGTGGAGFLAQLDGNNTAANGAYFGFVNAANTRYFINQLDTNNDINYYYFNGSSWSSSIIKLSNSGGGTFTGNLTANSPSEGNTGEGIIAGRSFKIDASGTGQTAKMYVVSKDLSDTYGSGLQIQFANYADTRGFGFNLTTAGNFELYNRTASTWQRNLVVTPAGIVTKPNQPSFRAGRSSNVSVGAGATIVFNSELFDNGGHYNASTGEFTAPVAGKYMFGTNVIFQDLTNGQAMDDAIFLYRNSTLIAYGFRRAEYENGYTGNAGYYTDHLSTILDLAAGDVVKVVNNRALTVHGNTNFCFFYGFLVH